MATTDRGKRGEAVSDLPKQADRLSTRRFLTSGSVEPVSLSDAQQRALIERVHAVQGGGLALSGYARRDTEDALRALGVIKPFSSDLTPSGLEIAARLRWERDQARDDA